jgi:hypothetical protein
MTSEAIFSPWSIVLNHAFPFFFAVAPSPARSAAEAAEDGSARSASLGMFAALHAAFVRVKMLSAVWLLAA